MGTVGAKSLATVGVVIEALGLGKLYEFEFMGLLWTWVGVTCMELLNWCGFCWKPLGDTGRGMKLGGSCFMRGLLMPLR